MLRRRSFILLAVPILAGLLLYGFRTPILRGIFDFLVIRDDLVPADVIFVLNGDTTVRPGVAAALYHRDLAPRVAIARSEDSPAVQLGAYPNPTDSNLIALQNLDVPPDRLDQIRPPGGVTSTFDEAKALALYSREHPLHKVIVVTTELHSRRARFIFRKALEGTGIDVMMAPVPDRKYQAANWWKSEDGLIACQNEYIKLVFYYFKYS